MQFNANRNQCWDNLLPEEAWVRVYHRTSLIHHNSAPMEAWFSVYCWCNQCWQNSPRWNYVRSETIVYCVVRNSPHHKPRRSFTLLSEIFCSWNITFLSEYWHWTRIWQVLIESLNLNTIIIDNRLSVNHYS